MSDDFWDFVEGESAAASDLLAALKSIVNSDMAMREEDEGRRSPELQAARAAISKAEGPAP